jgi:hypothetical protein
MISSEAIMKGVAFRVVALALACRSLVLSVPPEKSALAQANSGSYKYFHRSSEGIAEAINGQGVMKFVEIDGQLVPYSEMTANGKSVDQNAKIIGFFFPNQIPALGRLIVNRLTNAEYSWGQKEGHTQDTQAQSSGNRPEQTQSNPSSPPGTSCG